MREYTECDEVADNIAISLARRDLPDTFEEAAAIVKSLMPDETMTVRDNVAERLWRAGKYK